MTDRTLDQMCTVTRPGLAAQAGAAVVELLASVLNHPLQGRAPPRDSPGVLGAVPHQIRGSLSAFSTMLVSGEAFPKCAACSPAIVSAYRQQGREFVRAVCTDPGVVERVAGLDRLQSEAEGAMAAWVDEEDEDAEM